MDARIHRMTALAIAVLTVTVPRPPPSGPREIRSTRMVIRGMPTTGNSATRRTRITRVLPGQARLNGTPRITRPRANTFQQFSDSLEERLRTLRRVPLEASAATSAVYQSFRQYDKEYHRIYRPNVEADKGFDDRLKTRTGLFQGPDEKDPAKRARMLRELEQDSLDRRPPAAAGWTFRDRCRQTKAANPHRWPRIPAGPPTPPRRSSPSPPPSLTRPAHGRRRARMPPAGPPLPASVVPSRHARPTTTGPRRPSEAGPAPDPSTIAIPPPR